VLLTGMNPTPMTYFAAATLGKKKCQGAIQVTASHNPGEYNGFKFTKANAEPMSYGQGLEEVEKLFQQDMPGPAKKSGKIKTINLRKPYIKHCHQFCNLGKTKLKIAIDTGNGVMGAI